MQLESIIQKRKPVQSEKNKIFFIANSNYFLRHINPVEMNKSNYIISTIQTDPLTYFYKAI